MRVILQAVDKQGREDAKLTAKKTEWVRQINVRVGQVRVKFVTDLPAQEMIYLRKEQEARSWLDSPSPNINAYPLMKAEVGITAPTANELAQIWLYMSNQWLEVAAVLEQIRLGYIGQIMAEPDEAQCLQLFGAFEGSIGVFEAM